MEQMEKMVTRTAAVHMQNSRGETRQKLYTCFGGATRSATA